MKTVRVLLNAEDFNLNVYAPAEILGDFLDSLKAIQKYQGRVPRVYQEIVALLYYHGQVLNGGHNQWVGNLCNLLDAQADLRGGIEQVIGASGRRVNVCRSGARFG